MKTWITPMTDCCMMRSMTMMCHTAVMCDTVVMCNHSAICSGPVFLPDFLHLSLHNT